MIIDPHVHLRDWEQKDKETITHGLETASLCGINGVFDMPNCLPTLTNAEAIQRRLEEGEAARRSFSRIHGTEAPFYAVYAGITADRTQLEEIVELHRRRFPRVVGLKLFAGRSTGPLAVISSEEQKWVWRTLTELGYSGTVAIHCEKEELMHPELWDPDRAASHSEARPPQAEEASAADQIAFAREAGFSGNLHICHISTSAALEQVRGAKTTGCTISCGATPHHLLIDTDSIPEGARGLLLKVNPPLRSREDRLALVEAVLDGTVDWIESDHAPHSLQDKYEGHASGIPSMVAWPLLLDYLKKKGISKKRLNEISGTAVIDRFGLDPQLLPAKGLSSSDITKEGLFKRYAANGWSLLDCPEA